MSCRSPFSVSTAPVVAGLLFALASAASAVPRWIWAGKPSNDQTVYLRHEFELQELPERLRLAFSCDNKAEIWINGERAGSADDWRSPSVLRARRYLKPGRNVIAVKAWNEGNTGGFVAKLETGSGAGAKVLWESGPEWKSTAAAPPEGWEKPDFNDESWTGSLVIGTLGDAPWGNVFGGGQGNATIVDADKLNLLPGFKAELLYVVPKGEEGSWVSLTLDDRQRLIAGDQDGALYRITVKEGAEPEVEQLNTKVRQIQGLLYANGALYAVRNGGGASGLYRLRDTDGDDQFDEEVLLRKLDGDGEHGPHAVILGPDGKSLYVCAGNFTKIPDPETSRVPKLWQEDQLLTRMPDAGGHDPHIMAPAGWVARTDFDGKSWELVAVGFRNHYDIAFDRNGDLFTYDSDMEWDIGLPWYRPTRICHVVPGAEFGFRNGSGKFPVWYPDNLPPVVDIGPGSPTGVLFGYGSKFPPKYERAFYALDWTYGTMYAIHLKPNGATWTAEKEEFISGKPLPLTDAVIRPADGAMYFLIGGRKTQSGLYRVKWVGETAADDPAPEETAEMKLRKQIEAFQTAPRSPAAVEAVWPHLNHPDRFIRFAARSVIELQPVEFWKDKALAEQSVDGSLTALLALTRAGDASLRDAVLQALDRLKWETLTEEQRHAALRTYALVFIRLGLPDEAGRAALLAKFDPLFPSSSLAMNDDLSKILAKLGSKQFVPKAMQLMATAATDTSHDELASKELLERSEGYAKSVLSALESRPNRLQMALAYALREAKEGWTPELYRQYFRWFNTARKFEGGHSLKGFIENMRKEALAHAPESLRGELDNISGELLSAPEELPQPKGPGHPWTMDELLELTANGMKGRNFENGKLMYKAALCASCHRFGTEGGGVGPDITGIGNRYTMRDLLENILEPSKVISDQYESTLIEKVDGTSVVGRIVKEEGDLVSVAENPLAPLELTHINQSNIKSRSKYPISAMPPALLNSLNKDEVLDLLAFLMSGGDPRDKAFQP